MELENFVLEKYDYKNLEHRSVIISLANDDEVTKTFGDFCLKVENIINSSQDICYIVRNKSINKLIGFVSFEYYESTSSYGISYAILKEWRLNHYGTNLLKEFSDKLFVLFPNVVSLSLQINKSNLGSIKVALNSGFQRNNDTRYNKMRK